MRLNSIQRVALLCAWLVAIFALTLAAPALAQLPGATSSEALLSVKPALSVSAVKPGETVKAAVVLTLPSGWHMNSNKPTLDFLRPTEVTLNAPKGIKVGPPEYPAAHSIKFSFSDEPLSVFEGAAVVTFPLTVATSTPPGTPALKGTVSFQPCNQTSCYPPATKAFTLAVPVAAPGAAVSPANQDVFAAGSKAPPTATAQPSAPPATHDRWSDALSRHGLLAFLGLLFLAGLALNLTPCVYPMIAVTMSVFGAQVGQTGKAGQARGKMLGRAVIYVLGMATMYTALGLFAALTGRLFGDALQSVWVEVGIAAFLFVLALSMFGVYELQPPPRLAAALGGANRTGLAGTYLSGLVVGIFAAPCTGPVVLSLLAMVGQRRDAAFGTLAFFILALGLGAPYIALASFTGLLGKLPRSGAWMEWVKRVFGVILVAVAARYLVLAVAPEYVDMVVPAALVLGAIYLAFLEPHGRALRGFQAARAALGVVALAAGIWLGAGAFQDIRAAQSPVSGPEERWEVYSDAALSEALAKGQPVVMDFSASWCAQCKELEHRTFTAPEVRRALNPFRRLRVDLDGANKPQAAQLQKKWSVPGLPTVVFLDGSGKEVASARIGGFLPPHDFLARVAMVTPQMAAR